MDVEGNEKVDKRVVTKALSIFPGEIYSEKAIHQSQVDLYRSQMFRQVRISIEDSVGHRPTDTLVAVNANVLLAEYPLQRLRLSGGYGSLDCLRTTNALVSAAKLMLMPQTATQIPVEAGGGAYSFTAGRSPPPSGTSGGQSPLPELPCGRPGFLISSILGG